MSPSRRRVLALLGGTLAAGVAGCPSTSDGRTDAPTTDASPPRTTRTARDGPVPTPEPPACPEDPRVPTPQFEPDAMVPVPDPPGSIDEATVREYVEDYELAYKWRAWSGYSEGVNEFHVDTTPEVTASGENFVVVEADSALPHGEFGGATPEGYFDGPSYAFAYLVTDGGVWRAQRQGTGPPPDPRSEGTLLECFGE